MGGTERVARQHEQSKLTVRERLDLLFDPGTFVELGLLAHQQPVRGQEALPPERTPTDGVVTGHGLIEASTKKNQITSSNLKEKSNARYPH